MHKIVVVVVVNPDIICSYIFAIDIVDIRYYGLRYYVCRLRRHSQVIRWVSRAYVVFGSRVVAVLGEILRLDIMTYEKRLTVRRTYIIAY